MTYKLHYALIINALATISLFAKTTTLTEALQKKWVNVHIIKQAKVENNGKSLRLTVKNLTNDPLNILAPAGQIFAPPDSNSQNFIQVENTTIELAAKNSQTVSLLANCINASRMSPHENAVFSLAKMATGNLLKLSQFIADKRMLNDGNIQCALWAVSDNEGLVGINDDQLLKFTAQLTQKPLPTYQANYRMSDEGGHIAAQSIIPLEIRGQFQYTLPEDMRVKLDLVDAAGKSVIEEMNLEVMNQTKGRHRFSFHFNLKGIPRGEYFVTMAAEKDRKEWGKMKVVF